MATHSAKSTPNGAKKRPSDAGKRPDSGPILRATTVHLAELDIDPNVSPLAAVALNLAAYLDAGAGLASAGVSKELRAVLAQLEPAEQPDADPELDELLAPLEHAKKS